MSYDQYGAPPAPAPPVDLWPAGNYEAVYIGHECKASQVQGTPGIHITFWAAGKKEVVVECWVSEKTLAGMTGDQLAEIGWNGEYGPNCEFAMTPETIVPLYMQHDTYKGKTRERWNISTHKASSPQAEAALTRACQDWKAKRAAAVKAAPAPAPRASAPPPARAAAPSLVKPALPPARTAPSAPPPRRTPAGPPMQSTHQEAWDAWAADGKRSTDSDGFWGLIDQVLGAGRDTGSITPSEWAKIRDAVPPF